MKILPAAAAIGLLLFIPATAMAQAPPPAPSMAGPGMAAPEIAAPVSSRAQAVEIRRQARGQIKKFYAERGFWPLWIVDGKLSPAANRFIEIAETSSIDGLKPKDYDTDDLRALVAAAQSGSAASLARAELGLSQEFARYVRDIRLPSGKMRFLDDELRQDKMQDDEVLRRAALAKSFADYIFKHGWMSPEYSVLRDALLEVGGPHVDGFHADGPVASVPPMVTITIPAGRLLRPGGQGERVALLRRRLMLAAGDRFDSELAAAVESFQKANGLDGDGLVGPQTLAVLNAAAAPPVPVEKRAQILRINLERARHLPGPWTRHVVVNAASGMLSYFEGGAEQGRMKVVVGSPDTPTPMFAGMVQYATLNPYWNVPVDLARKTIAPAVLRGISLDAMRYQALSDWTASARILDPATVDWAAVASGGRQLRLRKLPGPTNAMGDVKFMFPNDSGIFLHDTPSRHLFDRDARQFSNGCIRLEDAGRLGRWFFGKDLELTSDRPEQHRPLPRAVPVYVTYLTAVPSAAGVRYLADVYGRDTEAFPPGSAQMVIPDLGG